MKFVLEGRNDFYGGYLARVLEQPDDTTQNEIWRDGWAMADETCPEGRGIGFVGELRCTNNISVTVVKD